MNIPDELGNYDIDPSGVVSKEGDLTIVMSPSRKTRAMQRWDLSENTLHIVDKKSLYFLYKMINLLKFLKETINDANYRRVNFVGSSKGGFGALNVGARLSRHIKPSVHIAAFSPQISLWPKSKAIRYPSYTQIITLAQKNAKFKCTLEKYGNSYSALANSRAAATIIYGASNITDKHEAELCAKLPNVRLTPLNIGNHLTMLPYLVDIENENLVRTVLEKYFNRNAQEADVAALKNAASISSYIQDYSALAGQKFDLKEVLRF